MTARCIKRCRLVLYSYRYVYAELFMMSYQVNKIVESEQTQWTLRM